MEDNNQQSLSINDLKNTLSVIDYACEQGAFKGWKTIENVLVVRAKLEGFVQYVEAQNAAAAAAESAQSVSATETPEADVVGAG